MGISRPVSYERARSCAKFPRTGRSLAPLKKNKSEPQSAYRKIWPGAAAPLVSAFTELVTKEDLYFLDLSPKLRDRSL
jgi:hypothetical protein